MALRFHLESTFYEKQVCCNIQMDISFGQGFILFHTTEKHKAVFCDKFLVKAIMRDSAYGNLDNYQLLWKQWIKWC